MKEDMEVDSALLLNDGIVMSLILKTGYWTQMNEKSV
jgi:hypothetical protein